MVPIHAKKFLAAFAKTAGGPYEGEPPATLAELFDGLHDPDEFGDLTAATLTAARAAVTRKAVKLTRDPLISTVTVYAGNVRATKDFTFNSHVLVLGDLVVDGVVTASPEHAILMVAGDLRCRATHLMRAYLFVTDDVVASECFFGCLYGLSFVAGTIKTPLYLHDESWGNLTLDESEETLDNIEAKTIVDIDAPTARAELGKVLQPSALGTREIGFGAGDDDIHELLAKIARREPVFFGKRAKKR